MKTLPHSPSHSSKGAALMIVLAFVVLLTGLVVAYFSRTTTDRQLAQSSFNDTSADLLSRSALDIVVSDLKQEIVNNPTVSTTIAGMRTLEHVRTNLACSDAGPLDPQLLSELKKHRWDRKPKAWSA